MLGQFIIPTCAPAGLRMRAYMRNTLRVGESCPPELRRQGISVDLRVFANGALRYHEPQFAKVPFDGVQEISEATCPALSGDQAGILIVARCSLPSGDDAYFAQEHQLFCESPRTGAFNSLLYDQIPVTKPNRTPPPIILVAPKTWAGTSLNSYVAFASTNSTLDSRPQGRPLTVSVLDERGTVLVRKDQELSENSVFLFDVRAAVRERLEMTDVPRFFTVVARGGASSFAIMTFVVNEATGNVALEHSLSPHYYMSGDQRRVRDEALRSPVLDGA